MTLFQEMLDKLKLYADEEETRIADLKEEDDYGDDDAREDIDDQIGHHTHLLKELKTLIAKAEKTLKEKKS